MEDCSACLEEKDFEGAELLLTRALEQEPRLAGFFHFQFGRIYHRWNKLTSAINHLHAAIDLCGGDEVLRVQVVEELKAVKDLQLKQRP